MTEPGEKGYTSQIKAEENVSEAVLRTVAAVSNRPLLELPPLHDSVDADSLDQLFASSSTIDSLQFEYGEYEVTLEPGHVHVRERR